jgi:hypothetical protein
MAAVRNNMTRAVEMRTCLGDKGMHLAKKITRVEIENLVLINLAILLITFGFILIDISISRLCGARILPFREKVAWGRCECFEHMLRSKIQAMRHASASKAAH